MVALPMPRVQLGWASARLRRSEFGAQRHAVGARIAQRARYRAEIIGRQREKIGLVGDVAPPELDIIAPIPRPDAEAQIEQAVSRDQRIDRSLAVV
jgi:hypothetical protein